MPRTVTTRWTAAGGGDAHCNKNNVCPGVHDLEGRPDVHYVIGAGVARTAEVIAWRQRGGRELAADERLFLVPPQMSPDGYMPVRPVTDLEDLAAMAPRMGPGEVLGTIPAGSWKLQEVPG